MLEKPTKPTEITITAKPFKIATDDLLAPNTVNFVEQYEKFVLGKFDKKEGNEMIESMNLINLYASKHKESIEKETKEKVEELRKKCDVINKYNELLEQFEKDCDDLYLSQFTEEERKKLISNDNFVYDNKPLLHSDMWRNKYSINYTYTNDEIMKLETNMVNKVEELNDLVKTVKAHIGIAKTKDEVEEILIRYGIIDKKGKLVVK